MIFEQADLVIIRIRGLGRLMLSSIKNRALKRPSPGLLVGVIALIVALGGVAYAAIPSPTGEIMGCYANDGGSLRIVDQNEVCLRNETAITFNQKGPPGPQGLQGLRGPQGLQGVKGDPGASAPKGNTGSPAISAAKVRTKNFNNFVFASSKLEEVMSTFLPAGNWTVTAVVNDIGASAGGNGGAVFPECQLRLDLFEGNYNVLGRATERFQTGNFANGQNTASTTLTILGATRVPARGREVKVYCRSLGGTHGYIAGSVQIEAQQVKTLL